MKYILIAFFALATAFSQNSKELIKDKLYRSNITIYDEPIVLHQDKIKRVNDKNIYLWEPPLMAFINPLFFNTSTNAMEYIDIPGKTLEDYESYKNKYKKENNPNQLRKYIYGSYDLFLKEENTKYLVLLITLLNLEDYDVDIAQFANKAGSSTSSSTYIFKYVNNKLVIVDQLEFTNKLKQIYGKPVNVILNLKGEFQNCLLDEGFSIITTKNSNSNKSQKKYKVNATKKDLPLWLDISSKK